MPAQPFDFGAAQVSVQVLHRRWGRIVGGALQPDVEIAAGGALLRAMAENVSGLTAGDLQAIPAIPNVNLAALPDGLAIVPRDMVAHSLDDSGVDHALLHPEIDGQEYLAFCIDPAFGGGAVLLPTLKAWSEALGGTYDETGVSKAV